MRNLLRALTVLACLPLCGHAWATCTGTGVNPLAILNGSSAAVNMSVVQNADGSCSYYIVEAPPPLNGFGSLVGTGVSALVSTLTLGQNSGSWPASPGLVQVVASGGIGYVCPKGGPCSATVGIPIGTGAPVAGWGFDQPSTSMTVFATSAVTFTVQW